MMSRVGQAEPTHRMEVVSSVSRRVSGSVKFPLSVGVSESAHTEVRRYGFGKGRSQCDRSCAFPRDRSKHVRLRSGLIRRHARAVRAHVEVGTHVVLVGIGVARIHWRRLRARCSWVVPLFSRISISICARSTRFPSSTQRRKSTSGGASSMTTTAPRRST